jgi:SAM-dependent methyltransferase
MRRLLIAFALASLAAGFTATAFWLYYAETTAFAGGRPSLLLSTLVAVTALSTVNFAVRWFRWHFLTRRFVRTLPTRTSIQIYFGTLPAFATPLYVGELIRTALAARRGPRVSGMVLGIWGAERIADAAALGAFFLIARAHWVALAAVGAVAAALYLGLRARVDRRAFEVLTSPRVIAVLALSSTLAWLMPVTGLWIALRQLAEPIAAADAAGIFSVGTFLGGFSLLPLGSGVTGSSMIVQLREAGVGADTSVAAIALFRVGTSWYALGLGMLALVRWRREIVAFVRAHPMRDHFDALAHSYDEQIPPHVRDRVVGRKVAVMSDWLASAGVEPGSRGLEIGCGHGWYAAEMTRRGFAISACDRSGSQLAQARAFFARSGLEPELARGDARTLPFADGSFDFAYGVNVLHHVAGPGASHRALRELVRVLEPGGSFFLHEINTENPLFAFYMGYVFPLLRDIDDGTEMWIKPSALPRVEGARWDRELAYLTFLPDFVPRPLLSLLGGVERMLERSALRRWSAHYVARLVRDGGGAPG